MATHPFLTFNRCMHSMPTVITAGTLLAMLIGLFDYLTMPELAILYLIPISLVAWNAGRWPAIAVAVFSTALWLFDNITGASNFTDVYVASWEATVRFGFFIVTSLALSRLSEALYHERMLSRTDNITQIANRRYFLELTEFELRRARRYRHPFTVAFMDVDNFKGVNDTLGHHAGDELLRLIGATLRSSIRSTDLAARVGGDEFTVLFPEIDEKAACGAAAKLQQHLHEAVKAKRFPVTFSIGVVTFLEPPASVDEALRRADEIMYDVKKHGKNTFRCTIDDSRVPASTAH